MRRAVITALLVMTATAFADEPAEDPKQAIADRGIVLKAGKRNLFVVVPEAEPDPETPKGSVLHKGAKIYVDKRGPETRDLRVLLGKRGALKPVPLKELANDASALTAVTSKGVLTIKKDAQGVPATATWGPAKKPVAVDVLQVFPNRKLIYQELGIYTNEKTGHPCDEL